MRLIGRIFSWIFVLLLLVYIVLFLLSWVIPVGQQPQPEFQSQPFLVIAHQGGDGLRPSNTLSAFGHAVELGVDVLEMDIHSTSDGVLVTIHDDTVDRTTDGTGRVNEMTFAELQELDAGYHWPTLAEESHRTDRPFRGQGITVPSLEEVFQAYPDMLMNIEIKQQEPSIVKPFCDLLQQYDRIGPERVLVASFHQDVMDEFQQECPDVPTAVVQNEVLEYYILNILGLHRLWNPPGVAFQVPQTFSGLRVTTPYFVKNLSPHGVIVHPWTVNDQNDMEILLEMGVDGIITDYPDQLLEIRGE